MDKLNRSCEPMDVDLSANSNTGMDISYSELDTNADLTLVSTENVNGTLSFECNSIPVNSKIEQPRFLKVYHLNKKSEKKRTSLFTIILPVITVVCISIIAYQVINVECNTGLDPVYLHDKLHSKLYGQNSAVNDLISTIHKEAQNKIIIFYGGTGVGKTYTVSLLLENAWNYSNVYHYTMPSFMDTFSTDMMLGLTVCKTAIIIIDDLTAYDVENIKLHVKNILSKSEGLEKSITIILIFNCDSGVKDFKTMCDENFEAEVMNGFAEINALKQFVKFEPLTTAHLKMCIEDEMRVKDIDEHVLTNILKNFDVSIDGCKGVHKKIKMLNFI